MRVVSPLFSSARGLLGGNVFASYNGQIIVRSYNPTPYDPNTGPQQAVKAKFFKAGQIGQRAAETLRTVAGDLAFLRFFGAELTRLGMQAATDSTTDIANAMNSESQQAPPLAGLVGSFLTSGCTFSWDVPSPGDPTPSNWRPDDPVIFGILRTDTMMPIAAGSATKGAGSFSQAWEDVPGDTELVWFYTTFEATKPPKQGKQVIKTMRTGRSQTV